MIYHQFVCPILEAFAEVLPFHTTLSQQGWEEDNLESQYCEQPYKLAAHWRSGPPAQPFYKCTIKGKKKNQRRKSLLMKLRLKNIFKVNIA